jgi:transketolase
MLHELNQFCEQRRFTFYPKADLPFADEILRGAATSRADEPAMRRRLAELCAPLLETDQVAITPLVDLGTFHWLYRVSAAEGRSVIARVNALSHLRRDFTLAIDGWVTKALEGVGLPTLPVLRVDLSRRGCPFDYEVLAEAPGISLKSFDRDEARIRPLLHELGRFVARLHQIPSERFGLLDVRPFVEGAGPAPNARGLRSCWSSYLLLNLERHVQTCVEIGAITLAEARRIEHVFKTLTSYVAEAPSRLLHGDLGNHNVFVDGGRIAALLDWEDSLCGDPIFEIAFWATFHPERRHAAFLEGYRRECPLPADFEQRFWLYFLRIALSKTVLRHRLGLQDQPGRAPASRRIHKALDNIKSLARSAGKIYRTDPEDEGRRPVTVPLDQLADLARRIRAHTLRMVHRAKASHVGTCLSMTDLLAVLYGTVLRVDPVQPDWPDRDRFLLSKGHGAAAVYATLAERGFFPREWLDTYCKDGTRLAGHVSHHEVPGVEVSSGSLGHGLSFGTGMALAGKRDGRPYRVFVLLSDGECDEGSIWEPILFAPHHHLDNVVAVVDYNRIQSFGTVAEVLDLEPFAAKWRAFGWAVREIDGHDLRQIHDALTAVPFEAGRPSVILAHTTKGKGVGFMEGKLEWHYKSPDGPQLAQALAELGVGA